MRYRYRLPLALRRASNPSASTAAARTAMSPGRSAFIPSTYAARGSGAASGKLYLGQRVDASVRPAAVTVGRLESVARARSLRLTEGPFGGPASRRSGSVVLSVSFTTDMWRR
jgi:hypothetical protein